MAENMKFYRITHGPNQWKKCGGCNWRVRKVWRYGKEKIDPHLEPGYANGLCAECMKDLIEEGGWEHISKEAEKVLSECYAEMEWEKKHYEKMATKPVAKKRIARKGGRS